MRHLKFGVIVLALAIAYSGILLWRLLLDPAAPRPKPISEPISVQVVQSDMCRLARAERAFFAATGHYAEEHELRSDGDTKLASLRGTAYSLGVYVPVPDRFVIVAMSRGPLGQHPPAMVVDGNLQVCTMISRFPRPAGTLDSVPEKRGTVEYECEPCK